MNYIQLSTGLILQFDINESPLEEDKFGNVTFYSGRVMSPISVLVKDFVVEKKLIVAEWRG